jgi:hypothetical protein
MTAAGPDTTSMAGRRYQLGWVDDDTLRISRVVPGGGGSPEHGLVRLDAGYGVSVEIDPLDVTAPHAVEARDGESARATVQGIFGWGSWPALRTAFSGADDFVAELDVRHGFGELARVGVVSWVNRWSPLPLRQELLDFELGATLVMACSAPAARRRAEHLLAGVAGRLPALAAELSAWGPDIAPLLQAARISLYGSRWQPDVDAAIAGTRVSDAAAGAEALDRELRDLLAEESLMARAGLGDRREALALPVDWDRVPPRVVPGMVETPVTLDLAAGTIMVQALTDRSGAVVQPREDLRYQVYRGGSPLPGLAGPLRLHGQRYQAMFAPTPADGDDAANLMVDVAAADAVAAVKVTPVATEGAGQRREAVREVTARRLAARQAGVAGLTLAELGWLSTS